MSGTQRTREAAVSSARGAALGGDVRREAAVAAVPRHVHEHGVLTRAAVVPSAVAFVPHAGGAAHRRHLA